MWIRWGLEGEKEGSDGNYGRIGMVGGIGMVGVERGLEETGSRVSGGRRRGEYAVADAAMRQGDIRRI